MPGNTAEWGEMIGPIQLTCPKQEHKKENKQRHSQTLTGVQGGQREGQSSMLRVRETETGGFIL